MSEKKLRPSLDPNIPHPGRTFYQGRWRTPEQIERQREWQRERQRERRANFTPEQKEKERARLDAISASRVGVVVDGLWFSYRVRPEHKEDIQNLLAEKREQMKANYRKERDGWVNQTVA